MSADATLPQPATLTDPYSRTKGKTITERQVLAAKIHGWRMLSLVLVGVVGIEFAHIRDIQSKALVRVHYAFLDPKTAEITRTQWVDDTEGDIPAGILIAGNLQKWVREAFAVSSDIQEQSDRRDRVYRRVAGTAVDVLAEYYAQQNPFEIGKSKVITVHVVECQALTAETWKLKWELHFRDSAGRALGVTTHGADLLIKPATRNEIDSVLGEPRLFVITDIIFGEYAAATERTIGSRQEQ